MCIDYIKAWACGHIHSTDHEPCRRSRRNRFCEVQDVYQTLPGVCADCNDFNPHSHRARTRRQRGYDASQGMGRILGGGDFSLMDSIEDDHHDFDMLDSLGRGRRGDRHHGRHHDYDHYYDGGRHHGRHRAAAPSPSPPLGDDDDEITGHFTEGRFRYVEDENDPTGPPRLAGYITESSFRYIPPEDDDDDLASPQFHDFGTPSRRRRHGSDAFMSGRSRSPGYGRSHGHGHGHGHGYRHRSPSPDPYGYGRDRHAGYGGNGGVTLEPGDEEELRRIQQVIEDAVRDMSL